MSRKQLVGITGQTVVAGECWWRGRRSAVGRSGWGKQWRTYIEWRGKAKGQRRAMEQATMRRGWIKDIEREKVYDRG